MNKKNFSTSILYGLASMIISILLFGILFSFILRFTSISENSLTWIFRILSFLIILMGGFIAGIFTKKRGFLAGLFTGILFSTIVLISQYLGYEQWFTMKQWLTHGGYLFIAMLGGMFGANITKET